jgi:hypothetical protein
LSRVCEREFCEAFFPNKSGPDFVSGPLLLSEPVDNHHKGDNPHDVKGCLQHPQGNAGLEEKYRLISPPL